MIRFHDMLLPLVLAVVCATTTMANPIDEETARQNALQFIHNDKMKRVSGAVPMSMSFTVNRNTATRGIQPMLYAFNIGDGDGYVIVSGDDEAEPILGFADEGAVSYDELPDNMRSWLEGYADEIAWVQANRNNGKPQLMLASDNSRRNVPNLVAANWHQTYPYNIYCVFKNYECATGCVATAMAEIMFYWGVQGCNGETYKHGCKSLPSYRTTTRRFTVSALDSLESFNWEAMTPTSPNTAESIYAIAKLMRYCGQSVKMDYDTYANGGSGAYTSSVARALINSFGYDKDVRYIRKDKYTAEAWDEILYNELASGRPVIMEGRNSSGSSGHAFICSGYHVGTGLYYFNWGWDGVFNGWYSLSALRISSRYDFRYDHSAVIGIQPPTEENMHFDEPSLSYLYLHSPRVLTRSSRTEDCDTEVELESVFTYLNPNDATWQYGIGVFNTSGELVKVVDAQGAIANVQHATQYSVVNGKHKMFRFSFGSELPYGTYELSPVYREDNSSLWKQMHNSYDNYVKAEVENDKITLTPSVDVAVNALSSEIDDSGLYNNTITITNTGCEETLGLFTLNVSGTDVATFEPHVAPGATESIVLDYQGEIKDTDTQQLSIDNYGYTHFYTNVSESDYDEVSYDIYLENSADNSGKILDNVCQARLYLCNKGCQTYRHTVAAKLQPTNNEDLAITLSQEVELQPHESQTIAFDFDGLNYDTAYDITLSFPHQDLDGNKVTESIISEGITLTHGVFVATANGVVFHDNGMRDALVIPDDALYVDARYSDDLESLYAGGNPNTLFLLPEGAEIPAALQNSNVVVGDHAEHITLDHTYDFYSPIDFTAANISYSRVFTVGHSNKNRGGWGTIALPFSVESADVTVNGQETTWFKSSEDSGRKFWLYEYTGDNTQTITFSYTLGIEAYKPYIIAVPDNAWGSYYDLRNKTFVFSGSNAHIKGGDIKAIADHDGYYGFIGLTRQAMRSHVYTLDELGAGFDYVTEISPIAAFNAYFVNFEDNSSNPVTFSFDNRDATPVKEIVGAGSQETNTPIYNLEGMRIGNADQAPRIYIVNGKKVIKK